MFPIRRASAFLPLCFAAPAHTGSWRRRCDSAVDNDKELLLHGHYHH